MDLNICEKISSGKVAMIKIADSEIPAILIGKCMTFNK